MPTRRMPSRRRMTVVHSLLAAIALAVVLVGIVLAGWSPHVGYLVGVTALAVPATVAIRRTGSAVWPSDWPPAELRERPPAGADPRLGTLATMLRRSAEEVSTADHRLRPLLADLAGHRLRRDHDVDIDSEPERARQLLGDDAFVVLASASPGPLTPERIARVIGAIERV